jgi:hypothetical protein
VRLAARRGSRLRPPRLVGEPNGQAAPPFQRSPPTRAGHHDGRKCWCGEPVVPTSIAIVSRPSTLRCRGIAFGISLTCDSVLARFGRDGFYLRQAATAGGSRFGPAYRLL